MNRSGLIAPLAAAALLSACDEFPADFRSPISSPAPIERPEGVDAPSPVPSAASENLAIYYRRWQEDHLVQGLLRTDGGGPDTPFTDTQLATNFVRIALFDEYVARGNDLKAQATLSKLRRWEDPIRMHLEFGDHIPPEQRETDRRYVADYAARLSRLTGVPITQTGTTAVANFHVLMLNEDDRLGYTDRLRALAPGIADSTLRYAINLPRDQLCLVIGLFKPDGVTYDRAIAIIRGEHPDLLRLSCIHEELAQGMGLANDYSRASPSIFNDNEEFGLLTSHDELLLKMLYDTRFTTGMSAAEAAPIARQIATELMADQTM